MEHLNQIDKEFLSFPDSKVLEMNVDRVNKKVEIHTNSCWIDSYQGLAKNCSIVISDWDEFIIQKYDSEKNEYCSFQNDYIDYLAEILVFDCSDNLITFEGYSVKSNDWIVFKFYNATIEGMYGEKMQK